VTVPTLYNLFGGKDAILEQISTDTLCQPAWPLVYLPKHEAQHDIFGRPGGTHQGRYSNTRTWKSKLGNLGSMWRQFHIVHHLQSYIPIHLAPAAYWEMKPILEARDCRLGL